MTTPRKLSAPTYECALTVVGVDHTATDGAAVIHQDWSGTGHPALVLPPTMHPLRQLDVIRAACDEAEQRLMAQAWSVLTEGGAA